MNRYCTENPNWGFYGEMAIRPGIDAAIAFDLAAREIANTAGVDGFDAASWLDTRHGRHFGDDVANFLAGGSSLETAIHQAVGRWLSLNITPGCAKVCSLPEPAIGLPYLVGLLVNHAIERESLEADTEPTA